MFVGVNSIKLKRSFRVKVPRLGEAKMTDIDVNNYKCRKQFLYQFLYYTSQAICPRLHRNSSYKVIIHNITFIKTKVKAQILAKNQWKDST